MREILFRGKSIEPYNCGRWVYGFYTNDEYNEVYEKSCSEVSDHYIENQDATERVDPETVGQYTGLKDKNGKPIFEGDIIVYRYYIKHEDQELTENFVVEYDDKRGVWEPFVDGGGAFVSGDFEIIGNIHDNPELMGCGK